MSLLLSDSVSAQLPSHSGSRGNCRSLLPPQRVMRSEEAGVAFLPEPVALAADVQHVVVVQQPVQDRRGDDGVNVEVLERSDGQLMVQHEGKVIAHQEAPPKAGALRAAQGALAPTPELSQVVRNLSQHGLGRLQLQRLAALGAPADQPVDDKNGPSSYSPPPRKAKPCEQALCKAV